MKKSFILIIVFWTFSLYSQDSSFIQITEIEKYYNTNKGDDLPSISTGTVSSGKLENGKLMPFEGVNFVYFDTLSYLSTRAFVNDKVKKTILETYKEFETLNPERHFCFMECSNQHGGQLYPHHTHQNGLSVDFMSPLLKNGVPYYNLDTLGADHYLLDFDNDGNYLKDNSVSVDFNLIAQHILLLEKKARIYGLKISKVIIKIEFKDNLFATENGKLLSASGIYIVKNLTTLINSLHDDHYHIDFELL